MATSTKTKPKPAQSKPSSNPRHTSTPGYIRGVDADAHFNIRIPKSLLKEGRAYAKKAGRKVSLAHVIRTALAEFMKKHPDPSTVKWGA